MRELHVSPPELALIAATRGALGIGIGLLMSERLRGPQRKAVGITLFVIGALSTIPLALEVFGRRRSRSQEAPEVRPQHRAAEAAFAPSSDLRDLR